MSKHVFNFGRIHIIASFPIDSYRYYINNQIEVYTKLGGDKKYGEDKLPHTYSFTNVSE
nr:MAG TPA: hypothetical protein [Caudoviricetes sp.]